MNQTIQRCKESERINNLNQTYLELIQHLHWNQLNTQAHTLLGLDDELIEKISRLSAKDRDALVQARGTTLFKLCIDEQVLQRVQADQQERKQQPLGEFFSSNALLLEISAAPARAMIRIILNEIVNWHTFSASTAYRFCCEQVLIDQISTLDSTSLLELAIHPDTRLEPSFNASHVQAIGKTGLVPVALMFA